MVAGKGWVTGGSASWGDEGTIFEAGSCTIYDTLLGTISYTTGQSVYVVMGVTVYVKTGDGSLVSQLKGSIRIRYECVKWWELVGIENNKLWLKNRRWHETYNYLLTESKQR